MSGEHSDPTDDAAAGADTDDSVDDATNAADTGRRIRAALREVRREGWKAALVHATVDAALAALLVNVAIRFLDPPVLPDGVPLPGVVVDRLGLAVGTVELSIVAGAVAGLVVAAAELFVRLRRSPIERFEAANPEVREALRTARDAVDDGSDSTMALALYEDVIDRLGRTSSVGLLDLRRLGVTLALVLVIGVASIQVAVVGLDIGDLTDPSPTGPGSGGGGGDTAEDPGLEDGDDILGEAENVSAGDTELEAELPSQGSGDEPTDPSDSYDTGFSGSTQVEGQEAGFAENERLDDAELIRQYNLKIRETTDETESTS